MPQLQDTTIELKYITRRRHHKTKTRLQFVK